MAQLKPPTKQGSLLVNVNADAEVNGFSYPTSPAVRSPLNARNPKLENRLREAWLKAEKDFLRDTGKELGSYDIVKNEEGILRALKQRYDADGSDSRKSSALQLGPLVNVLKAVQLVGAFAAQAVSTVFGPAQMCFNAISFLIAVPAQIKKVYDELEALFREIEMFLTKFKIYSRIEDGAGLGEELFENTNNLLTCFVKVCGTAAKVLQGGFRDRLKNSLRVVLLQDDRVGGALEEFRKLCRASDSLANTVMLEHVMSSEVDVKAILSSTQKLEGGISILISRSNDEKTALVNSDRLNKIKKLLFSHPPTEDLLSSVEQDNNDETLQALNSSEEFRTWLDDTAPRSALVLHGPAGSGRSYMLEAIREHLNTRRENAGKKDASIYVVRHRFEGRPKANDDQDRGRKDCSPSIIEALKRIAYQVAMQSTNYTKDLSAILSESEKPKSEKELEKLFTSLKLPQLTTSTGASMYILLDGVEAEDVQNGDLHQLLNLLMEPSGSLQIKILLATNTYPDLAQSKSYSSLPVGTINSGLLSSFAVKEMQRMDFLQDPDIETRQFRALILEKLTSNTTNLTFRSISQRLLQLQDAINEDCPHTMLSSILEAKTSDEQSAEQGLEILRAVENELSPRGIVLLNKIIALTLWCSPYRTVSELEALLYLDKAEFPIEPLVRKIHRSFNKVITVDGICVLINPLVETALIDMASTDGMRTTVDDHKAFISLDIKIRNATEQDVRKFVWDLNEQITTGKMDFSLARSQAPALKIRVNEIEANLNLVRLLFTIVGRGWDEKTKAIVNLAYVDIPFHLAKLHKLESNIRPEDRKMLGEGLITYLTDTYYVRLEHEDITWNWMNEEDQIAGMRFWLEDEITISSLRPKERRWLQEVTDHKLGKLGFARDLAIAIGEQWLTDIRSDSYSLYNWLDIYIDKNTPMESSSSQTSSNEDNGQGEATNVSQSTEEVVSPNDTQTSPGEAARDSTEPTENDEDSVKIDESTRKEDVPTDGATMKETPETIEEKYLTDLQRVNRASAWVCENGSIVIGDSYNAVMGHTCNRLSMFEEAISFYEKVSGDYDDRYLVEIYHARCSVELKDFDAALEHARAGFNHLRSKADEKLLSETDTEKYFKFLKEFGDDLTRAERYLDAITFFEEALVQRPTDLLCRLKIIVLHCQLGGTQDAGYKALIELTQDHAEYDGKTLAMYLSENVVDYEYEQTLNTLARTIKSERMQDLLVTTIEEALHFAISRFDVESQCCLRNAQAQLFASRADPVSMVKAAGAWKEIINTRVSDNDTSYWSLYYSIREAASKWMKYESDQVRARVLENPSLDVDKQMNLITDLRNIFNQAVVSSSVLRDCHGVTSIERYIITLYGVLNAAETRTMLKNDMASALELLSDSDPDNDAFALSLLAQVFQSLGDKVGILTALSLCDRPILKRRLEDKEFGPESEDWSSMEFSGLSRGCDGCMKTIYSSDHDGLWWCPFCPAGADWCTDCKAGAKDALLKQCSVDHIPYFSHLRHTTYADEELSGTTVLVDWDYVEDDAGGYTRKGGRRIELAEWVEELRKQWDLPKPEGDGSRAQQ